jgi:hypothetical protein
LAPGELLECLPTNSRVEIGDVQSRRRKPHRLLKTPLHQELNAGFVVLSGPANQSVDVNFSTRGKLFQSRIQSWQNLRLHMVGMNVKVQVGCS